MSPTRSAVVEDVSESISVAEMVDQEIRKERQLRYALLADHQSVMRAKERQIRLLETRLKEIRTTRWWRLRRWLVTTISAVWWIEDHKD